MKPGQWLLLVATAASFASSILIGKILIGTVPPLTLAAMRVLLAAPLCFALLLAFHRELPRTRADRRTAVAASLGVIVIPYCCLAIGQQTIPSGLSGILYSMMPLFTLLVAHFVLHDERLGLRKVAGIGIGIAGVVAVIGPSLLGGLGQHAIAELITLCGPLAYAFGTVLMRRSRPIDPIALTTAMFLTATLVLLPLALIVEQPWQVRGGGLLVVELIALAIVGTILPAALNYVLVQQVGATRASIAMFLMPLIAVLFGVVFLDERLGLHALIGMGLILIGSIVVNGLGRGAVTVQRPVAGTASPPIG
ncbi:MAG: DMT family transporter [Burkholderiaceae bacterium]|nr:DMT family transporter [Burkholderiaceae bacterium]